PLPEACRDLLSRGDRTRAADRARADGARGGARRASQRRAGAFPAAPGRARHGRADLERPVPSLRAARRARGPARAHRHAVRRKERDMIRRLAQGLALAAALVLAGCDKGKPPMYQGWIEADLIFVAPDEAGRIEVLSVREGDHVALRDPLFNLDSDLQVADLQVQQAAVKNAQQAYDRAIALLRT